MSRWQGAFDVSQNGKAIISSHDIFRPYGTFSRNPADLRNLTYSATSLNEILLWCMLRAYQMGANPRYDIKIYLEAGVTNSDFAPVQKEKL